LAGSVRPGYSQNIATVFGGFGNIGSSLLSNLASIFQPRSQAAANQYDWTFPIFSIPPKLLNDPNLSDPYTNGDVVAKVLDADCLNADGSTNTSCGYISKVGTCFGADISKDSGTWDVTPVGNAQSNDIDPNSTDYQNAKCDDLSDPNWKRIILLVFDTNTMKSMACYLGDDQSCTPSTPTVTGNFTNPFPDGWTPGRLDMGYDGTFKNQIVAPFSGTITYASSSFSNWGGYIELKADNKPAGLPTSTLYFAEGVKPAAGITAGKPVNAGDPIADAYTNGAQAGIPGNIEWGVAQDGPVRTPTNTYVYGQCGSSAAKQAVLDFEQWAVQNLHVAPHDASLSDNTPGCP
jgi:hypothetical protein